MAGDEISNRGSVACEDDDDLSLGFPLTGLLPLLLGSVAGIVLWSAYEMYIL
jgi:hypothetical protein